MKWLVFKIQFPQTRRNYFPVFSVHWLMVKNKCNLQRKLWHQRRCLPTPSLLFSFFPTLALTSPCIRNIPPLILPSLPCTPSELTGRALGRWCWAWPLCFLLPWVRETCIWLWLMPVQGADGRAYPPLSPHLIGARNPPANAFSPYPIQAEQLPSPPKLSFSLPLAQDQFWAPCHLKIKLSYWFIDAWYRHFPFL